MVPRPRTRRRDGDDARFRRFPSYISIQFNKDFTFANAERITPYLARLGVSHVYASPYLKARAGSTHGYDIVDHNAFNPRSATKRPSFPSATPLTGTGWDRSSILFPIMWELAAPTTSGGWMCWSGVKRSPYAEYFDIEWNSPHPELRHKVLVPFLGAITAVCWKPEI